MVQEKEASKEMCPGRENAPEKGAKTGSKAGRESCRGMDGVMVNGMQVETERKRSWSSRGGDYVAVLNKRKKERKEGGETHAD